MQPRVGLHPDEFAASRSEWRATRPEPRLTMYAFTTRRSEFALRRRELPEMRCEFGPHSRVFLPTPCEFPAMLQSFVATRHVLSIARWVLRATHCELAAIRCASLERRSALPSSPRKVREGRCELASVSRRR